MDKKIFIRFGIIFTLIIIGISIPAGIYLGLIYIFGMEYMWYFFGVIFGLIFIWNIWIILRKPKHSKLKINKTILLILIFGIMVFSQLVSAETILLKRYNFPHPTGEYSAWFEIPNVILIWNYDKLTPEEYNKLLIHEYVHYLAWNLWGVHPQDHERFFTGKGVYLID